MDFYIDSKNRIKCDLDTKHIRRYMFLILAVPLAPLGVTLALITYGVDLYVALLRKYILGEDFDIDFDL